MRWPYRETDRLACPECGRPDRFQIIGQMQSVTRTLTVRVESVILRCECRCVCELKRAGTLAIIERPQTVIEPPGDVERTDQRADTDLPRRFMPARR